MPPLLLASALGLLGVVGACANPTTAPSRTQATPMTTSFPSNELLIKEVCQRLIARLPATGNYPIWLELGPGPAAAQAKADLLACLQREPRIVWSRASSQPGAPVADSTRPGQHVNTVVTQIEPRPELLLLVSVYQGRLYLGIRPPGRDPLGPQTTEWIWMLNGP